MSDNWGGKRDGAGSGGVRDGAGRPRTIWKTQGQSKWIVERSRKENGLMPDNPEIWELLNIDADGTVEFQLPNGDIISIIHPDNYE